MIVLQNQWRNCFGGHALYYLKERLRFGWLLALFGASCLALQAATTCASCHPAEATRFNNSAMGRSVAIPEMLPSGQIKHLASGSDLTVTFRGRRMIHHLQERGMSAEYPVAYQIGSGVKGRTYVVNIGNYLLESPISWYRDHGWDVSPGYEGMPLIDFDRPVTASCLFCHTGGAKFADADRRQLMTDSVTAISCERCHGNGTVHLQRPLRSNIINPAKLNPRARDGVCEQCHLEGDARIANPGKTTEEFYAGDLAESTFVTYLLRESGG